MRTQTAVDVQVDVAAGRHSIDPRIYGVAHADSATLSGLRIPLHRWGGNVSTRHNWQANASNRGSDWYFESVADGPAVAGDSADAFVSQSKTSGAEPIITIPTLGWVAKVGATRNNLASFSIAKYGAQTGSDAQWFPDAGNGISASTGRAITGNDPSDANVPSDAAFQRGWVQHLVTRWGASSAAGVRYYALDNEPSLWHSTHRDVHPNGASMDEVFNGGVAYATQIKAVDPGALVMGPEEWGWSGYFYSGKDQQWGGTNGWSNLPDRAAHGNADYLPWYLAQMRQRDTAAGQRLLDIFSVHYYPQGGQYGNDTSTAMQQLRNRSTRALWDPAYVDESWIGTQVQLIPRLKGWVASNYPGTKIGITEYNWGAENHINGATTQADILGIFGREGVDLATFWTYPSASTPTYKAIKLFRNYDGGGGAFGTTSVSATAPNPDLLSVFAAQRADNTLTIMAVNKDLSSSPAVNVRLANFTGQTAQVWRLTSSNAITRLADTSVANATISATLPAQSVTLFVVAPTSTQTPRPPAAPTNVRIVTAQTTPPPPPPPTGGTGTWTNVTPSNVNLTSDLDCGNFGAITVVSDPARPSNLYTHFDCQGIWKSTNYGATWSGPINTGSGGAGVNGAGGIAIGAGPAAQPPVLYSAGIRGTGMGFWKSIDGGVSWTNYNVAPGGSRQDFYPPVVNPHNPNHLLMAGHEMNLLVQSVNGGQNWTAVPTAAGMNQNGGTGAIFFINTGSAASTASTFLWLAQMAGGAVGTWRTTNGGASWTRVDSNEHPHGTSQLYQDANGVAYMAGVYSSLGWGVLRSTNYGQTWSHVGSTANGAVVYGTPNYVYSQWSWACGHCTTPPDAQRAAQPALTGWSAAATPSGMTAGAAQAAVVFDGTRYVVVTANWLAGIWRYVE
ncbi:MAG: glycoside hydrolase family 44 protein [Vicinamibacterales bacterium]